MARLIYSGDLNIEHGGMFYSLQTWKNDYVNVLRVVPCSDAGGPDNCFWIEHLTVTIQNDATKRQSALDVIGVDAEAFKKMKPAARRHALIEAHVSYGYYDTEQSTIVRIGKPDTFYSGRDTFEPAEVLRGNTSLERYAREQAHAYCD